MSRTITTEENTTDQFKSIIGDVVRTLQRNAAKAEEMKHRTSKVLENAASFHSGTFTRGYSSTSVNQRRLTTSLLCKTLPRGSQSHQPPETRSLQSAMEQPSVQANTLNSMKSDLGRKTINTSKLKTIVFKTLDRIFQLKNVTSPQSRTPQTRPNIPETSDPLRESTLDRFLDGPACFHPSIFQASCSTLDEQERDDQICLPDFESCSAVVSLPSSSSDDDGSWMYVDDPVRVQEVIMDDSLNYSFTKRPNTLKKCKNKTASSKIESQEQPKRPRRYIKRTSTKSGESKIERLHNERYKEPECMAQSISDKTKDLAVAAYNQKLSKASRPDSPIDSGNKGKRQVWNSASFTNLLELSFGDSVNSLPDFNTNSFSRGIALRPSSTLLKDAPNLVAPTSSTDENHDDDNDDDASSTCTASSFSSMQTPEDFIPTTTSHQRENTAPKKSALCKDVDVLPIHVPVISSRDARNIRGISNREFRKISEVFIISEGEDDGQRFTSKPECARVTSEQCRRIKESIPKDELKIVQDAFSWLEDNGYEGTKENIPANKPPLSSENQDECSFFSINETGRTISSSICSTLNSTVPPPPPLPSNIPAPPPMPLQSTIDGTVTTPRSRLPLRVFTQPWLGNNIFNQLECLEIGESDAKELKEKFPLSNKTENGAVKVKLAANSETLKFQLNIELFLKKWDIAGPKVDVLLESISTLNAKPNLIDMACITALPLPKEHDIEKIKQAQTQRELEPAEDFLWKLNGIPHLTEKLSCIEFSLDFHDSTQSVFQRLGIFTSTCHALSTSRKFIKIIEVVMALMNSLNTEEGSKIYGFDIQSLTKLSAKTSEDGTTTLLHFLIEYILNNPSFTDSVDFYHDFNDLSTVSKTCLQEIKEQCGEWKKSLAVYGQQLQLISGNSDDEDKSKLEFPIKFQKTADSVLADLTNEINAALQLFKSCKECYGLAKTAITETDFFESLSRFIADYRKIHGEVVEKTRWAKTRRPNSNTLISSETRVPKAVRPQKKSCSSNGLSVIKSENDAPGSSDAHVYSDELENRFIELYNSKMNPSRVRHRRRKS